MSSLRTVYESELLTTVRELPPGMIQEVITFAEFLKSRLEGEEIEEDETLGGLIREGFSESKKEALRSLAPLIAAGRISFVDVDELLPAYRDVEVDEEDLAEFLASLPPIDIDALVQAGKR
jgi:hypothetical protein